jgi:hypothetical protein
MRLMLLMSARKSAYLGTIYIDKTVRPGMEEDGFGGVCETFIH